MAESLCPMRWETASTWVAIGRGHEPRDYPGLEEPIRNRWCPTYPANGHTLATSNSVGSALREDSTNREEQ